MRPGPGIKPLESRIRVRDRDSVLFSPVLETRLSPGTETVTGVRIYKKQNSGGNQQRK